MDISNIINFFQESFVSSISLSDEEKLYQCRVQDLLGITDNLLYLDINLPQMIIHIDGGGFINLV
jgi:hypothetical protein